MPDDMMHFWFPNLGSIMHLDFLINETARSHAKGARVEVCAHLAISQKNMFSEPFWPDEGLQYGL